MTIGLEAETISLERVEHREVASRILAFTIARPTRTVIPDLPTGEEPLVDPQASAKSEAGLSHLAPAASSKARSCSPGSRVAYGCTGPVRLLSLGICRATNIPTQT